MTHCSQTGPAQFLLLTQNRLQSWFRPMWHQKKKKNQERQKRAFVQDYFKPSTLRALCLERTSSEFLYSIRNSSETQELLSYSLLIGFFAISTVFFHLSFWGRVHYFFKLCSNAVILEMYLLGDTFLHSSGYLQCCRTQELQVSWIQVCHEIEPKPMVKTF